MKPNKKEYSELKNVAYQEDVNAISEKVERCYSKDRYEDFQEAVEKICGRYMKFTLGVITIIWLLTIFASMLAQKFFGVF